MFILWLILGAALAAAFFALPLRQARVRERVLEEEKLRATQEKDIVVEFMHHMVHALGEGLDRQELYSRIVHAAVISTGALSACLFEKTADQKLRGVAVEGLFPPHRPLPDQGRSKQSSRARFIEQVLRSETFDIGEGIAGAVAKTRQALLIRDGAADSRIIRHEDPALHVHSLIAAPILYSGELIGVLVVVNPADGLPFNETDFSLVQSLAEQAGLAVHNQEFLSLSIEKKQLDIDLALASSVQAMILPQVFPKVPGLDLDAYFHPAQRLGGDLYDCFPLPGGRLALAVADVSGKGIAASIIMAICRTNLRRIAPNYAFPSRVLSELNRLMAGEMREGMYITLLLAFVDPQERIVTFARAGHELPVLCHENTDTGRAEVMQPGADGMPVGMVEPQLFDEVIRDATIRLAPGDVFCLYTDGVTEAAEGEKEFGTERLAEVIRGLRQRSAREINQGILDGVHRFTGSTDSRDDMTILTLRCTG